MGIFLNNNTFSHKELSVVTVRTMKIPLSVKPDLASVENGPKFVFLWYTVTDYSFFQSCCGVQSNHWQRIQLLSSRWYLCMPEEEPFPGHSSYQSAWTSKIHQNTAGLQSNWKLLFESVWCQGKMSLQQSESLHQNI